MKKSTQIVLFIIAAVLMCLAGCNFKSNAKQSDIITIRNSPVSNLHTCIDKTHELCDGNCECDGLGCEQSDYKAQFEKMQKLLPGKDSLYIDAAIKED